MKSFCTLSSIQSSHRSEDFTEGKRKICDFSDWPTYSLSCLPMLRKWNPEWLEISTVLTLLWDQWMKSCCVSGWKQHTCLGKISLAQQDEICSLTKRHLLHRTECSVQHLCPAHPSWPSYREVVLRVQYCCQDPSAAWHSVERKAL